MSDLLKDWFLWWNMYIVCLNYLSRGFGRQVLTTLVFTSCFSFTRLSLYPQRSDFVGFWLPLDIFVWSPQSWKWNSICKHFCFSFPRISLYSLRSDFVRFWSPTDSFVWSVQSWKWNLISNYYFWRFREKCDKPVINKCWNWSVQGKLLTPSRWHLSHLPRAVLKVWSFNKMCCLSHRVLDSRVSWHCMDNQTI